MTKFFLSAKDRLNTTKVIISNNFIDSYISDDKFVPVNIALKKYDDTKEAITNPKIINMVY